MNTQENKNSRLAALWATGVAGTLLLGSTTFFYVGNNDLKKENQVMAEKAETLTSVKEQLQTELKSIDVELKKYKGKSEELDNLLNSAYADLKAKEKRIKSLLKHNASLEKFKKEAKSLRKMKDSYMNQVKEMEEKLGLLSEENRYLKGDNAKLRKELDVINSNYMLLERKVEEASVLKVDHVLASAEKKSRKGKYSKTNHKKADRLLVNFELSENRIAEQGDKNIYIRIIDPTGKVLPGGSFTNEDGNIELPYSVTKSVNYNNVKINSSVAYDLENLELKEGEYTLEFYCEGHFCGASKYKLK